MHEQQTIMVDVITVPLFLGQGFAPVVAHRSISISPHKWEIVLQLFYDPLPATVYSFLRSFIFYHLPTLFSLVKRTFALFFRVRTKV